MGKEKNEFQKNLEANVISDDLVRAENTLVLFDIAIEKAENEAVKDVGKIEKLKQEREEQLNKIKQIKQKEQKTRKPKKHENKVDIKTANYDELLARREEIKADLEEMSASAVKDVKKKKQLEKELMAIEKQITDLEGVGLEENKKDKEEQAKKKEETEFDIKTANYDELLAKREEIKLALEETLAAAVVDVEKKKRLEKELIAIEAAIQALEGIELEDYNKDKEGKEEQEQNEKKEEAKDENKSAEEQRQKQEQAAAELNEAEKQEQAAKEAALRQAYYDAMLAFYVLRETNQKRTINSKRLVSTPEEYLSEIKAEDKMYKARDAYLEVSNKDPFEAQREELREQEKRLNKEIMDNLNKKAEEYRKLEKEIDKLNKSRQEKLEEIGRATKAGATQNRMKELNDELAEIDIKLKNKKQDMAKIKENLSKSIDILANRKSRRQELSLESREYRAQSYAEKQNIKYRSSKDSKGVNDYKQAEKQENQNIKKIVEEHETRFKELKKELKKVNEKEPDNFAKKLELLKQLDDTSQQLKASRETQKDIEKGIEPDTDEAIKKTEKDYKSKEERKSEFKKQAEDLIEAAKEKEKKEGEQTVADPTKNSEEVKEEKKEEAVLTTAAVLAVNDGMGEKTSDETKEAIIVGAAISATEIIPPSPIDGLGQEQVKQIDDTPEGRENAEKTIEMAKEAQIDANKIQQRIEKEVQE